MEKNEALQGSAKGYKLAKFRLACKDGLECCCLLALSATLSEPLLV